MNYFTLTICFQSESLYGFIDKIIKQPHGKININIYDSKWQELIDLLLQKDYKNRPDINKVLTIINNIKINFDNKIPRNILLNEDINNNKNSDLNKINEEKMNSSKNQNRNYRINSKIYNFYIFLIVLLLGKSSVGKTSFMMR